MSGAESLAANGSGRSRWRFLLAFLDQSLHLVHELRDVLELPIDRGEADVGHLVELLQMLHDQIAQLEGRDLLLRPLVQPRLDVGDDVVHGLHAYGSLLTRLQNGAAELLAVEGLAPPIALDDAREHVLDVLVRGVAAVALEAGAPAPDELPLTADAGIDHPILAVAAEGALHARRSA